MNFPLSILPSWPYKNIKNSIKTDLEVESGLGQVLNLELLVGLGDEAESNLALAEAHGGVPHLVLHQVVVLVQLPL